MHPVVAVLQFIAPVGSVIVSVGVPFCVLNARLMEPSCAELHPVKEVCPRQNTSVTVIVFGPRLSSIRSINAEEVFSTVYVNCESMVCDPPLLRDQVALVPRPPGVENCAVVRPAVPPPKISMEAVSGSVVPVEFDGPAPAVKLRKFLSVSMHPSERLEGPNELRAFAVPGQLVSDAHAKPEQSGNNNAANTAPRPCPENLR